MKISKFQKPKTIARHAAFFCVAFVIALVPLFTSCASIIVRRHINDTDFQVTRVYPGTTRSIDLIGEMRWPGGQYGPGAFFAMLDCMAGGFAIVDLPFTFALDTVLLPTDLIFGPGKIIGAPPPEPSAWQLRENTLETIFQSYRALSQDMGVRYRISDNLLPTGKKFCVYEVTLDSAISGFSEAGQTLYEFRYYNYAWGNIGHYHLRLVYSVFWLHPDNSKILFLFQPSEPETAPHSIVLPSPEHAVSIRECFGKMSAAAVPGHVFTDLRNTYTAPNQSIILMTSEEETNAVLAVRKKYRELTGSYPDDSWSVKALGKFMPFAGDIDPPPRTLTDSRIEVLVTEPHPTLRNGILKAMMWVGSSSDTNAFVEVLYPITNE